MTELRLLLITAAIAVLCIASSAFSQTASGKISGKITDTDTGEPIIGANVSLVNTSLGASTNIEGEYVILNVLPGTYAVRISYVGYQSQLIEGVRVVAGVTRPLDVKMKVAAVEIGDVIVTAERKFFEEKATNDVRVYDSKQVENLPVKGVEKILGIQAGAVTQEGDGGVAGNATVNVRGGRGGEVLYVIDGIPQNDLFTGNTFAQVSSDAIEQVSFQLGGFEAKYGQAQSGIANVTTKSGTSSYSFAANVRTSTLTDEFDYNVYNGSISGPLFPGLTNHSIYLFAERGWFKDGDPSAVGPLVPSIGLDLKYRPNNEDAVWRFSGKTIHDMSFIKLILNTNINFRNSRDYIHRYVKNNSHHNPRREVRNYSFGARLSRSLTSNSVINVNVGYTRSREEVGDGLFFRNLEAYGDPRLNPELAAKNLNIGSRIGLDRVGVFYDAGRVSNSYTNQKSDKYSASFDFNAQFGKHEIELGGEYNLHTFRRYEITPVQLSFPGKDTVSFEQRARLTTPFYFGFDVSGQRETATDEIDPVTNVNIGPRKPIIAAAYVQDKYELQDLTLKLGVRMDYFDTKAYALKDETLPFDPVTGAPVLEKVKSELIFSPRIGLAFPITATTKFYAGYGKFVQQPKLEDVYTDFYDIDQLKTDQNFGVNTGRLRSEVTTAYELGFNQILGENSASLGINLFYKNTEKLVNTTTRFYQRQPGGQLLRYYGPSNYDFGTIKGATLTLDVRKIKYLSLALNYTFQIAEGTGSSTNSSLTATFRNVNGEVPIIISPLDFDQRHTGTVNINFSTGADELGFLENVSANFLAVFASGRPYTPLQSQDLLAGSTNYGDTKGYVNSAFGPGSFSVSMQFEKLFKVGQLSIAPYVLVENLFAATNVVEVYQSTGDPYTTGFLLTDQGRRIVQDQNQNGNPNYESDYKAFERDPSNFGIPQQIRLGIKVGFGSGY